MTAKGLEARGKSAVSDIGGSAEILSLTGISKQFGSLAALTDVSLTIGRGEVHCLLGENGAGKSTLCNVIFGVHQPQAGAMRLNGKAFRPLDPAQSLAAGIAMVHQHFSVIGTMTVVENLMLGQVRGRLPRRAFSSESGPCRRRTTLPSIRTAASMICRSASGSAWKSSNA